MRHTLFTCLLTCSSLFSAHAAKLPIKLGGYSASLQLNQTVQMPVHLTVAGTKKSKTLQISNAEELITLNLKTTIGDTFVFSFPDFDSELRLSLSKKSVMNGFWINHNKAGNYRIPFHATYVPPVESEFGKVADLSGKWETYFSPNSEDKEKTIGVFHQEGNKLTGTVLTETGDYRYLQGIMDGSHFYLSAFDGTHAFLLTGNVNENHSIEGNFYSGKHYQTSFIGTLNPNVELRNGDSITYAKDDLVSFNLKNIDGADYSFPNKETKGKVVIIQIMGTWCPNCMDETNFYKELYAAYHDKGLEIISVGYEATDIFEEQARKLRTLKERHDLDFTFLVGGKADKALASKQFAMLNEVISFPTSIYIGRDGQVKRIHTGFNGPGTGSYYTEYVEKTHALIQQLLAQ